MKIVLLGDSGVGKTTIINSFCAKSGNATASVGAGDF
jgi:small GTP-binding protein